MSKRTWIILSLALSLALLLSACGPSAAPSTAIPTLAPRQVTPAPAEGGETPAPAEPTHTPERVEETPAPVAAVGLEEAQAVYEADCQACHGANGQNAAVGPNLYANPDLASMSDADIYNILMNGVQGTAMQSFADRLSEAEINGLVALLRSWQGEEAAATETPEATPAPAAGGEADLEAGLAVFAANCAACHGAEGKEAVVGPVLNPNAALAAMADGEIRNILVNGIEGSAMPAFGDRLSEEEIDNLVAVIRSWQE